MRLFFRRMAYVCLLGPGLLVAQSTHNGDLSVLGKLNASTSPSTQPMQSVAVDPTGTCATSAQMQVNTSATAQSGDIAACVNGNWAIVGGPTLTTYTPTMTGGVATSYRVMLTSHTVNATAFGVAAANASNDTQLANAMAAAFNPNSDGQATPSQVLLPCGTLKFNSQIQIPSFVDIIGCGRGDSAGLVPPKGRGTVLQATANFNAAAFPANMVVLLGGSGTLSTELFGSRVDNLTIDAAGHGGGLMVANCQEMCGADRIQVANFKNYGFVDWGADNNGNNTSVNTPWGLPPNYQGSANDGPYTNFEFYPGTAASPTTVPILIANVAGLRSFRGFTVAAIDPSQNSGVNTPHYCAMVWGTSGTIEDGHMEGCSDGMILGPYGSNSQYGDGAIQMVVKNLQYSTPQAASGSTVHLQNVKGITLLAIRGGQTSSIADDRFGGLSDNSTFFVADYRASDNFSSYLSTLDGISLDAPITTTDNITGNNITANAFKVESPNPCFVLQYAATTAGNSFPYQSECLNSNGDRIIYSAGGAGGDFYYQGGANIGLGPGVNKSGLNLSSPEQGSNNVMGLVGNNLFFNSANSQFQTSGNGQSDANGLIFDQGSVRIVGSSTIAAQSTLTPQTVNGSSWSIAEFDNTGLSKFGNNTITGQPTSTFVDSSGTCTVSASQRGISCSTATAGLTVTKNLMGSNSQACTESFQDGRLISSTCP